MNKRLAWGGYLLAVHVALAAAVLKGGLMPRVAAKLGLTPHPARIEVKFLREVHDRMDDVVPAGATIFLGDSHFQSLPVSAVAPLAVNFAIGSQRSDQLLDSMALYDSMERARAVVVMVGTNDIAQGLEDSLRDRYRAILAHIPSRVPVVMASVPPMVGVDVRGAVLAARDACSADQRCRFLDANAALSEPGCIGDDGVHLTPKGNAALIRSLRSALSAGQAIP